MIVFTLLFSSILSLNSWSQVIGPSVVEAHYSYQATFLAEIASADDALSAAEDHANHMFGLMHSPYLVKKLGVPSSVEGIGSPRAQMNIKIAGTKKSDGKIEIKYSNRGKMLLHKSAAQDIFATQKLTLPLPYDIGQIYDRKCTDEHYDSESDYWYFYDPYRRGCQYLLEHPYAKEVEIAIRPAEYKKMETTPRLDLLRGNNGNGKTLSIFVVHGFSDSARARSDEGRSNFNSFNEFLLGESFKQEINYRAKNREIHTYTKEDIVIKHLLIDTGIESRGKSFAKFFKDAIETADIVLYAGHSGLGGNLDIPSLEEKAGGFNFNPKKRQIFFFDSCSSYSYYLTPFAAEKSKSKIDIISYGLSSYFYNAVTIHKKFMKIVLSPDAANITWPELLGQLEAPLRGGSYLLNVGGL